MTTTPVWIARDASLIDVPAIVRFLDEAGPMADDRPHPADGLDDEQASSAMRLILSHTALDTGRILMIEDTDGIVGVAVWMSSLKAAAPTEMLGILNREVGLETSDLGDVELARAAAGKAADLSQIIHSAGAEWTLVLAARRDEFSDDTAVLDALVAPIVSTLTGPALAVVARPVNSRDLEHLGFCEIGSVPLVDEHRLWVGRHDG